MRPHAVRLLANRLSASHASAMRFVAVALLFSLLMACGDDAPGSDASQDSAVSPDATVDAGSDDSGAEDAAADAPSEAAIEAGASRVEYSEEEPNDGTPLEQVNTVEAGWKVSGQIEQGDLDWFFVNTAPGKIYRLTWVDTDTDWGRQFTVLDAGRGGGNPGEDYTKLLQNQDSTTLMFFSFGSGGHYVAVSSQSGEAGSYNFLLEEVSVNAASGEMITFPSTVNGQLPSPGSVVVHPFEATEGTDIEIRLDATELPEPSEIDSRLYVYAPSEGSWIMRNDDDGATLDSRVRAPLPAGGSLWLVVENVELKEPITRLNYRLTATIYPN